METKNIRNICLIGHGNNGIRHVFVQETQCRLAFAPEAEDEDAFAA